MLRIRTIFFSDPDPIKRSNSDYFVLFTIFSFCSEFFVNFFLNVYRIYFITFITCIRFMTFFWVGSGTGFGSGRNDRIRQKGLDNQSIKQSIFCSAPQRWSRLFNT